MARKRSKNSKNSKKNRGNIATNFLASYIKANINAGINDYIQAYRSLSLINADINDYIQAYRSLSLDEIKLIIKFLIKPATSGEIAPISPPVAATTSVGIAGGSSVFSPGATVIKPAQANLAGFITASVIGRIVSQIDKLTPASSAYNFEKFCDLASCLIKLLPKLEEGGACSVKKSQMRGNIKAAFWRIMTEKLPPEPERNSTFIESYLSLMDRFAKEINKNNDLKKISATVINSMLDLLNKKLDLDDIRGVYNKKKFKSDALFIVSALAPEGDLEELCSHALFTEKLKNINTLTLSQQNKAAQPHNTLSPFVIVLKSIQTLAYENLRMLFSAVETQIKLRAEPASPKAPAVKPTASKTKPPHIVVTNRNNYSLNPTIGELVELIQQLSDADLSTVSIVISEKVKQKNSAAAIAKQDRVTSSTKSSPRASSSLHSPSASTTTLIPVEVPKHYTFFPSVHQPAIHQPVDVYPAAPPVPVPLYPAAPASVPLYPIAGEGVLYSTQFPPTCYYPGCPFPPGYNPQF